RHRKLVAEGCSAFRTRHPDDLQPAGDPFGQEANEFLRRRAGADAELHSILDMFQSRPSRFDLQSSCVQLVSPLPDEAGFLPTLRLVANAIGPNCLTRRPALRPSASRAMRRRTDIPEGKCG